MIRWMRSWSGGGRGAALALLACALLIRLAIPQGWMPDASAHGFAIKPCPGVAEARAPEPAPPKMHGAHHDIARHDPAKHDPAKQMPCDFAGAIHAAALAEPLPARLVAIIAATRPPAPPLDAVIPGRGLAAPPPPSTGPPLRA